MKKIILGIVIVLLVAGGAFFALGGSKEQKAARHLAAAQELTAKGDDARAIVELRNALQQDTELHEARTLFASLLEKAGRRAEAFGQYRYILEKNPGDSAAARAMALISFDSMAWDDARKYVDIALAARPDDPEMQIVKTGLDYRDGVTARDEAQIARSAAAAERLLAQDPSQVRARRVVVANQIREQNPEQALKYVDDGIALLNGGDRDLDNTRVVLLGRLGRTDEVGEQLLSMVKRYPEDAELGQSLVRFYVSTNRLDEAESVLRSRIGADDTTTEPRMVLLRFLAEIRSPETMRDELEKILAEDPLPPDVAANPLPFRALKAQVDYSLGAHDKATAEMEALIKAESPPGEIDRIKVQLAKMREGTGNTVGARALIEEVLARDPGQTEAIKMKANWLISDDKTTDAITMLRGALTDAPNDSQVLVLLARAYQREGRPELMSDMLARAVEVSNQAPDESLRYAGWLFQQGQFAAAETVAIDSLRRQPDSLELLVLLARAHLGMEDWGRAQQDIDTIGERFNTDESRAITNELRAQLLSRQGRNDELGQFLDGLARASGGETATKMALIRNTVVTGNLPQALSEAEALVAENPNVPEARFLVAQLRLSLGQADAALADIRALTEDIPDYMPAWLLLQSQQIRTGQADAALETVTKAMAVRPDERNLIMAKAFILEKMGDIDGAIAIYEDLYARNSDDLITANNLASLLASTREDQASLDRAWLVARRLNGTPIPALQDTYGWIAFRRGDVGQALPILEKAAQGLPEDPSVLYHLGRAYAARGRVEDAKTQYDRADALLARGIIAYPTLAQDLVRARADLN